MLIPVGCFKKGGKVIPQDILCEQKVYNLFAIRTLVLYKEMMYNIFSCSGSLASAVCECKELLPGRAVRLAPVRAWQVLFLLERDIMGGEQR